MKKVLVINGPNLNMLGKRDKNHYGVLTLDKINELILKENDGYFDIEFYQSNYEGDIVSKIQESLDDYAIIINPAAYTHTSVAIRDALEIFNGKIIEVHLSEVDSREDFRRINYIRDIVTVTYSGEKELSYVKAIKYLKDNK